jgi:hypothetical protein
MSAAAASTAAVLKESAILAAAGEIYWPEKEWIDDVIKGGLGQKGKSLQTAALRWKRMVESCCNGEAAALSQEWRKADASGNGTVSRNEVSTWLVTAHPYFSDSLLVQYAFHAVLALQSQMATRSSDAHTLSPPSRPSKASSQSLTFEFFPPFLSNLVAASRAVVLFRLWDAGTLGADKRLQRKEWTAGVKTLKRVQLTRDELAAEWRIEDADGKGAALLGEFCAWLR